MTDLRRRGLLGALAAGGALAAAARTQAVARDVDPAKLEKEADIACLYHCDFGENGRYDAMLRNMANHLSVYDANPFALKLVSVHHGAGIRFHLKSLEGTPWAANPPDPEFEKRLDGLAQAGVEVYLCKITFQRFNLDLAREGLAVHQVRAVGRGHRGGLAKQGFRLSEGWIRRTVPSHLRDRRLKKSKDPVRFS